MIEERIITYRQLADRAMHIRSLEECKEVVQMLAAYRREHPDDHYATDVACVISKVIDANGWSAEFPD